VLYFREWLEPYGAAVIAMFFWPAPLLFFQSSARDRLVRSSLTLALPVAAGFSGYFIALLSGLFAKPRIGSTLACVADGILCLVGCLELVIPIIRRLSTHERSTSP
jgi:hypothetical protein